MVALTKNHDVVADIRRGITDRTFAMLLPITDADVFGDVLDDELRKMWASNESQIPIDTGDLRRILTGAPNSNREVRARSGRVEISIKHNGVFYRSDVRRRVMDAANLRMALRNAMDRLRRDASRRSRPGRRSRR